MKPKGHICRFFGKDGPCVSSTKSMTRPDVWMVVQVRLVYSYANDGAFLVAPNINLESLKRGCANKSGKKNTR